MSRDNQSVFPIVNSKLLERLKDFGGRAKLFFKMTTVKSRKKKTDIFNLFFQGCHLMTEFVNRVEDDEARNALALCVTPHREEMKGFTKK